MLQKPGKLSTSTQNIHFTFVVTDRITVIIINYQQLYTTLDYCNTCLNTISLLVGRDRVNNVFWSGSRRNGVNNT